MASDLKIEIFAYNLFNILWDAADELKTKPSALETYGDECKKVGDYEEALDEFFLRVISFRFTLFNDLYKEEFTDEKAKSLKSTLDCYEYVISTCDREDLFGHLTVFQRMFATLTFVLHICLKILRQKAVDTIDVVKHGHLFWAMYFDKYTEEFYEKGGWKELKKEAKLYKYLPDFVFYFRKDVYYIQKVKDACGHYRHFKSAVDFPERKQKHPIHISYLWIKFRIKHFEKYICTQFSYDSFMDAYQSEQLLEDLKSVLNLSTCNIDDVEISEEKNQCSTFLTEMSYSKIHCGTKEMNPYPNDGAKFQVLTFDYESRIGNASNDFSHISTDNVESQCRHSTSTTEELTFDIIDSNGNCNSSKSYIEGKKDSMIEYLNDGKAEEHDEITNINQIIDIYQKEEIESHKQNCPRDLSNSILAKEGANNFNAKIYPEEKLRNDVYSNTEKQSKFSNAIEDTSTSHIGVSDFDGLYVEPFLKPANEKVNSDDERKLIRKALKDLRKEQVDPEIKNFLKLLLVLGEKEGAKFVFSTFESKEKTLEKSPENLNKQKKRSKKKRARK